MGVGSVEGGSESVGDVSSSVGRMGEVMTLLSYSSSASESAWYAVGNAILIASQALIDLRALLLLAWVGGHAGVSYLLTDRKRWLFAQASAMEDLILWAGTRVVDGCYCLKPYSNIASNPVGSFCLKLGSFLVVQRVSCSAGLRSRIEGELPKTAYVMRSCDFRYAKLQQRKVCKCEA